MDEFNEKINQDAPQEENSSAPAPEATQKADLAVSDDSIRINSDELPESILTDAPAETEEPDLGPLPEEEPIERLLAVREKRAR